MKFRFEVELLLLASVLLLAEGQLDIGGLFKAIGGKTQECFSSRLHRAKMMRTMKTDVCINTKALRSVLKGDLEEQSSKLKCSTKCFMESYGVMDPNGGILPSTLRTLIEQISAPVLREMALDRVDTCIDDADEIDDSCQKSANVIMCITKNGLLTLKDLPQTLLTGVKILQQLVATSLLPKKDTNTQLA